MRRLRPWARWADVVVALLFLVICLGYAGNVLLNHKPLAWLLTTSVPGLIVVHLVLSTLLSPKSSVLFSGKYREQMTRSVP